MNVIAMRNQLIFLLFYILHFSYSVTVEIEETPKPVPDCDSEIYCRGDLLKEVQLSEIFDSSLDFIRLKLKDLPTTVVNEFKKLDKTKETFGTELEIFVKEKYFEPHLPVSVELTDWKLMDSFETHISHEKYRDFYKEINEYWNTLAESTTKDAELNPEYHSMIHLPNYYIKASENSIDLPPSWRSYLIVRGLLSNQMYQTAAGIIYNYAELIKTQHFALYSNRLYWSQRSSLPFLTLMAQEYIEENTADENFTNNLLEHLESDFMWWYNNRRVEVVKNKYVYLMFRYYHFSSDPRPDNYKEDYKLAGELLDGERSYFYSSLRDLDESIFKISSRFVRTGKYSDNRFNLNVANKIPVELNCLLLKTVEIIASWHLVAGNREKHIFWNDMAKNIATAINEVLYDAEKGAWFDWIISSGENDYAYYITNLMPLYTITGEDRGSKTMKAVKYMIKEQIITSDYRPTYLILPSSKQETGGEWDYPYGSLLWNVFIIGGLQNSSYKEGNTLATNLARSLMNTIYNEFNTNGRLLEHYRVNKESVEGSRRFTRKESGGGSSSSKNMRRSWSSFQEADKISASTLGATIDLFKTFGRTDRPMSTIGAKILQLDNSAKKFKT